MHGCGISRGAPSISHLLFADDSLQFFKSSEQECYKVQSILGEYEKMSSQAVNFQKSRIFFNSNVLESLRMTISNILGVSANTRCYLGLPSLVSRNKRAIFAFLREKMWTRLQGW